MNAPRETLTASEPGTAPDAPHHVYAARLMNKNNAPSPIDLLAGDA
jgi:hypothetical protein